MPVIQINPKEALSLLKSDEKSALIDVRTFEEFTSVGLVDPETFDDRMVLLPWQTLPEMNNNPDFDSDLEISLKKLFGNAIEEVKLFFLCRVGGRSNAAGNHAVNLGYKNCYNITHGFEGELNNSSQRGEINGWKADNLPWRKS